VEAITPVQDDGGWLLAAGRGFAYLSVDGTLLPVAEEVSRDGQTELVLEGLTISNRLRATEDWSDEQRRAEPTAGLTYRFDTDATGQPAAPFRPDPTWWATVIS
jgi:hypothetical protein